MKKKIGILGASGFTGIELIKILLNHPKVELKVLNSRHYNGKYVSSLIPTIKSQLKFTLFTPSEINKIGLDLLFFCMPNGEAMRYANKFNIKIIDLSADYRFNNFKEYEKIYGTKHINNKKAVYGLPELFRDKIKSAKLTANPGCYATAALLSVYPIKDLAKYIIFDCKSGFSGAGSNSEYIKDKSLINNNIIAYNIAKHRHKYEINQFINKKISFTPHVINTFQGIMCTSHIILNNKFAINKIKNIFRNYYKNEKFVKVIDKIPSLHNVQHTNNCVIGGFEIDENNQLVIVSVIDNLIKGAAGQAVQNMNLMLGFDESEGLTSLI